MEKLSNDIIKNVGGLKNIASVTNCMTRVRITVNNVNKINEESLKSIEGVMGVITDKSNLVQIVVGPGTCVNVKEIIEKQLSTSDVANKIGDVAGVKQEMKDKYEFSIAGVLKTFGNIFVPAIPALIACGLIAGITNMLKNPYIAGDFAEQYPNFIAIATVFGKSIFVALMFFISITAANVFGGISPSLAIAITAIITSTGLANIELFGNNLSPGRGGIIAVIASVYLGSLLEKWLRTKIKGAMDIIIIPMTVLVAIGTLTILVIQPIAGVISDYIGYITTTSVEKGGAITGFILAGAFLPLVLGGLHQALIPIHTQLIESTGVTILFPILAMAGAGQVGASFAVLLKTKNKKLKKIIKSALPVGILGIGEPLIYGVTLPLGKPFLTACLGGAAGGAIIAMFKVGALGVGISGLPLAFAVDTIMPYLLAVLVAYVVGFIATYLVGFKDLEEA